MNSMTHLPEPAEAYPRTAEVPRIAALDDVAVSWVRRGLWAACIGVYLTVFIGGIQAGGDELMSLGRAAGFTLAAALLGRIGLGMASRASLPGEAVPMDDEEGRL